ncbi:MAG: asparagine--tRNA ligase [Nanoarchaeota archaeon]
MAFTSIQRAMDIGSGDVEIRGWVFRERGSQAMRFIVLRDSSNTIQCVVKKDAVPEAVWNTAQDARIEASIEVHGEIKPDTRAPTGFEVTVKDLKVVGPSHEFPITKDQSPEFLLDQRHLWLRSQKLTAVMKIRSTVFGAIDEYFRMNGYFEIQSPVFTPNACEGGATLFEVKYFDDKVYLTQSWQLYAEAMISALERIYCIGPCFRSERSKTSRHLAEFWMTEMEAAWADLREVSNHAEGLVCHVFKRVLECNRKDLAILQRDIKKLEAIKPPFKRMTYTEAIDQLKKQGHEVEWGKDLRTTEEDDLVKGCNTPIIVTNYPKEIMAFYKPADPADPKTALCFDMIAPDGYGEIVGGSQRETDIDALIKGLKDQGEKVDNYQWYLDTRRYGNVPHAGFGMGVERVVAWICGLDNIKDAIPFPRTMLRKTP